MSSINFKKNTLFTNPFQFMVNPRFLGLFLLLMLSLFSCSKEEVIEEIAVTIPFVGNWSGSLSSGDTGNFTLNMVVKEDGTFSMTLVPDFNFGTIRGEVTVDGLLEGVARSGSGGGNDNIWTLTGLLEDIRGSGDWDLVFTNPSGVQETIKGSWVAEKDE